MNKWTPVDVAIPPADQVVLCVIPDYRFPVPCSIAFCTVWKGKVEPKWRCWPDIVKFMPETLFTTVTHWMYMPKMPDANNTNTDSMDE